MIDSDCNLDWWKYMEIVGLVQLLQHPLWTSMNHSCRIGWCTDYRGTRFDLVNCMRVTILTWMARRLPKAPKIEKSCSPEASECLAAMVFIRSSEPVNMLLTLLSVKHCKTRCLCPADQCQILRSFFQEEPVRCPRSCWFGSLSAWDDKDQSNSFSTSCLLVAPLLIMYTYIIYLFII